MAVAPPNLVVAPLVPLPVPVEAVFLKGAAALVEIVPVELMLPVHQAPLVVVASVTETAVAPVEMINLAQRVGYANWVWDLLRDKLVEMGNGCVHGDDALVILLLLREEADSYVVVILVVGDLGGGGGVYCGAHDHDGDVCAYASYVSYAFCAYRACHVYHVYHVYRAFQYF